MQKLKLAAAFGILFLMIFVREGQSWRRRRRRRIPSPRNCQLSNWSQWSLCSEACGNNGVKTRSRTKTVVEAYGGSCQHHLSESSSCNRYCHNGGTPQAGLCFCKVLYSGKCCEFCQERQCQVSGWSSWGHCSESCGNNGIQTRTRSKITVEACGGTCNFHFSESRPCNRRCENGGTPLADHCSCKDGFSGKCCETCQARSCRVSEWSPWSQCSQSCGNNGVQKRSRNKIFAEICGGTCNFAFEENRPCNRYCQNGGTPHAGYCTCKSEFHGKCCEKFVCPKTSCQLTEWSAWSHCIKFCGHDEIQTRKRIAISNAAHDCGGTCHTDISEERPCDRYCPKADAQQGQGDHCTCKDGSTSSNCCHQSITLTKGELVGIIFGVIALVGSCVAIICIIKYLGTK